MRLPQTRLLGLSIAVLFLLITVVSTDSFATSVTYENISSPVLINFRNVSDQGSVDDVEDAVIVLDQETYKKGEIAILNITDANANVSTKVDFIFATVSGSSLSLTETDSSSGLFTTSFTVGRDLEVSYTADAKNANRARIILPAGFSGDLEFSDTIVTDNEADATCFYPVTGALKITGTLNVQPRIFLSYANANFTGPVGGNDEDDLGMYYKHEGEQFERITLPAITEDDFINELAKVIESKNSGDTGSVTGLGVLDPGGWKGITDYQGEYVLAVERGCGGGGGGGLVRPSLVVNALAGIGGFGGGADSSPPLVEISELIKYSLFEIPLEIEQMVLNQDSIVPISPMEPGLFENFDYPMTINDKGFVLGGFTSTIQTQTIKTDSPTVIKFIVYETTKIQHFSFYTNLRGANSQIHQSDTQILYNDGLELQIKDPNGFFSDVSVTINEINENKKEAVFEITFAKPMDTSDVIIRIWDPYFNSRDAFILDAIIVASEIAVEPPTPTFEEPVIEELQSQSIPKWIKNNAAWWSEQQISDSDFVAGIEYLIKNGIINVSGVEVGTDSASTEIPEWIKNNAAWWADSLISDDEFLNAMQWLVANGVIQI